MGRESFHDFLNTGSPRGRGRGAARGTPVRGGGRGRGGPPGAGGGRKADYSNVPFDYAAVNRQGYSKMEGFNVAPFGPGRPDQPGTPSDAARGRGRGRGAFTPGGAGRGRGRFQGLGARLGDAQSPSAGASGSATPVTGLGFHGNSRHRLQNDGDTYGGRKGAPLFVKAGELFKDGEVDDTKAEVDVLHLAVGKENVQPVEVSENAEIVMTTAAISIQTEPAAAESLGPADVIEDDISAPLIGRFDFTRPDPAAPLPIVVDEEQPAPLEDLFFIDTTPSEPVAGPSYTSLPTVPLGTHSPVSSSDEDEFVYQPRVYPKPQPISLPGSEKRSASPILMPPPLSSGKRQEPHTLSRKQRKAQKRDKRKAKKGQSRQPAGIDYGSDIDWGSDGPPQKVIEMNMRMDEDPELDVEVLRDYLAGTLLNAQQSESSDEVVDQQEESEESEEDLDEDVDEAVELDVDDIAIAAEGDVGNGDEAEATIDEDDEGLDSDSGSSSALGELILEDFDGIPLEQDSDSDDDDDEDDGGWNVTEEDWFIRNMQEALETSGIGYKQRKARNALFTSIETGDFGDDGWGLTPAKKNKDKGKHLAPELAAQWEKDRQKKAARREQRALERMMLEVDPYPSSRKGRGKSKLHQVDVAHLIPASATEIADMFDESDNDVAGPSATRRGGMGDKDLHMSSLDESIRGFLADAGKTTFSLPPMDKEGRMKVHMIAECYDLKSKSRGSGKQRFTILMKTSRSGRNVDERRLDKLLHAANFSGGLFYKTLYSKGGKLGKVGKKAKTGPSRDAGSSVRHREGDLVGEGADRIGMDNIGHKLLSKMGWAEGARIGRTEGGLDVPIVAVVKNTKTGLGAYAAYTSR